MAQAVGIRRQPTGRKRILRDIRLNWSAYAVLSPGFILFTLFVLFAIGFSFWLSFHKWNILEPAKPYVGLANYKQAVHDPDLGYFLGWWEGRPVARRRCSAFCRLNSAILDV